MGLQDVCHTCQRCTVDRTGICGRVSATVSGSPRNRGGACAMMSCGLPRDGDGAAELTLSSLLLPSPSSAFPMAKQPAQS